MLKVSDRVSIKDGSSREYVTIVFRSKNGLCAVQLDVYDRFNHDCGGRVRTGFGWWVDEANLELAYPKGSLDYILFAPLRDKKK